MLKKYYDNMMPYVQRERHETEIIKKSQSGLVHKNVFGLSIFILTLLSKSYGTLPKEKYDIKTCWS